MCLCSPFFFFSTFAFAAAPLLLLSSLLRPLISSALYLHYSLPYSLWTLISNLLVMKLRQAVLYLASLDASTVVTQGFQTRIEP
jgi:hypothetical protein